MSSGLKAIKRVAALVGGVMLLLALYVAWLLLRPSFPFVFRGDIEQLAASGPLNDRELASAICGTPVDFLGAPGTTSPAAALPQAKLLSWQLLYPMEGTASARIVGVGVNRHTMSATTGPCEAIITFRYRCAWVDNGRAIVLEKSFLETPKLAPLR